MPEIHDDEKLRSTLKSVYRPIQVSRSVKERVFYRVMEESSRETPLNPRHFFLRAPVWVATMTVVAIILISFGILSPPG